MSIKCNPGRHRNPGLVCYETLVPSGEDWWAFAPKILRYMYVWAYHYQIRAGLRSKKYAFFYCRRCPSRRVDSERKVVQVGKVSFASGMLSLAGETSGQG